jgi:hypothetical protein
LDNQPLGSFAVAEQQFNILPSSATPSLTTSIVGTLPDVANCLALQSILPVGTMIGWFPAPPPAPPLLPENTILITVLPTTKEVNVKGASAVTSG